MYTDTPASARVRRPADSHGSCLIPPTSPSTCAAAHSTSHLPRREEHLVEIPHDLSCLGASRSAARHYHEIHRSIQPPAPPPEPLSYSSLDAIPHDGSTHAPAHRHTKPRPRGCHRLPSRRHHYDKTGRRDPLPGAGNSLEIPPLPQPVCSLEATASGRHCYFVGVIAAKRFRPFARRRFRIARPLRELIRARNP